MKYPVKSLAAAILCLVSFGCVKNEPERIIKVETGQVTEVSGMVWSATGIIIDPGENGITQHGFCLATHTDPTLSQSDSLINLGSATSSGEFSGNLTGLMRGTTYYIRAYATN
ncbi:MAG: hypothetical protein KAT15_16830, partial [Bacteroidales bacterium]|nr:hypothetical protein [Bacteroidales bacterium]